MYMPVTITFCCCAFGGSGYMSPELTLRMSRCPMFDFVSYRCYFSHMAALSKLIDYLNGSPEFRQSENILVPSIFGLSLNPR